MPQRQKVFLSILKNTKKNALPGSSWSFQAKTNWPDGTQANDFFKVKTIRNADGEDTKKLCI